MEIAIKLANYPLLEAFVSGNPFSVYRSPVDCRLGIPGLSKKIKEITGAELKLNECYGFYVKNRDVVKILKKDPISMNIIEFRGRQAKELKAYFIEKGLLK